MFHGNPPGGEMIYPATIYIQEGQGQAWSFPKKKSDLMTLSL